MPESKDDILERLEIDEERGREIAIDYLRCFPRFREPAGAPVKKFPGIRFKPGDRKKLADLFFPLVPSGEPPGTLC